MQVYLTIGTTMNKVCGNPISRRKHLNLIAANVPFTICMTLQSKY